MTPPQPSQGEGVSKGLFVIYDLPLPLGGTGWGRV